MRRLALALICLVSVVGARAAQFDLSTATIADINAAIDAGALTSEKLTSLYLARIEAYDKKGPKVNAVITLNPKALEEARALDAERKAKGRRSPLHGIPVVIKDLIDLAGFPTTAGFKPFGAPIALRDAAVVAKLKESGAVILAKVSTMNWFGRDGYGPTHPIGAPLNPYNLNFLPGDSSSGPGAAMAAYFATVAVGTDTGGSVVNPAAYCSLAGMVATQGLISRAGIVPRGPTHDRAGPMARNVYDMTILLTVMSGWDAEDLGTYEGIGHFPQPEWLAQVKAANLQGKRIGVLREMINPADPDLAEGRVLFEQALDDLRKAGAQVVDPVLTGVDLRMLSGKNVSQYERFPFGNLHLQRYGPNRPFKTLEEMVEKVGADKVGDFYTKMLGQPPPDKNPDFQQGLRNKKVLRELVDAAAQRLDLDAFVFLFNGVPPPLSTANRQTSVTIATGRGGNLTSTTGLPAIIIPGGYTKDNLPVGIELVGKSFDDLKLLQVAYGYEQASKRRKTPETTPPLPGENFSY